MAQTSNYRLFCETEATFKHVRLRPGDPAPSACPTDPAHAINADSVVLTNPRKDQGGPKVDYRIYCETEAQHKYWTQVKRDDPAPTTCPADPAHAVNPDSLVQLDPIKKA